MNDLAIAPAKQNCKRLLVISEVAWSRESREGSDPTASAATLML